MAGDTIRVTGAGSVLIGPEGRTPPLPFITVDANEGRALIRLGNAKEYVGEGEGEAPAAPPALPAPPAWLPKVTPPAPEPEKVSESTDEGTGAGEEEGGEGRAETIAEALDLVEADGLVKTGDRKGKPKVSAIEAITGLTDVTAEEIDAAIAAKDAAE